MAVLYPTVMQKAEFVSDELRYLAEEISKQSVEGEPWFFFLLLIVKCKKKEIN